jgi:hypothetical protein
VNFASDCIFGVQRSELSLQSPLHSKLPHLCDDRSSAVSITVAKTGSRQDRKRDVLPRQARDRHRANVEDAYGLRSSSSLWPSASSTESNESAPHHRVVLQNKRTQRNRERCCRSMQNDRTCSDSDNLRTDVSRKRLLCSGSIAHRRGRRSAPVQQIRNVFLAAVLSLS